jgi:hypothetical protein
LDLIFKTAQVTEKQKNAFTDADGNIVAIPKKLKAGYDNGKNSANIKDDGHLRNWHLTHLLKKTLKEYR